MATATPVLRTWGLRTSLAEIPRKVGRQASPGDCEGLKRMAVIRADPGPFDAFRHNGEKQRFAKTRFAKKTFAKKLSQKNFGKKTFAKKTFAKKTFEKKTVAKKTVAKKTFAKKTFAKKGFFRSGFPIRGALRQMIANKGLAFAKPSPQKTRLVQIIDSPL